MTANGWRSTGSTCCGPPGAVVIYDETSAGNDHAAFSVGGALVCQHNPGRCSTPGAWGTYHVYVPPGASLDVASNETRVSGDGDDT